MRVTIKINREYKNTRGVGATLVKYYYPAKLFTVKVKRNFWKGIKCKDAPDPHTPGLNFEAKNKQIA